MSHTRTSPSVFPMASRRPSRLKAELSRVVLPFSSELPVNWSVRESQSSTLLKAEGYEVGTVTSGVLTIEFEDELVTLAEGDSITYPCDRPHLIGNRSSTVPAVATWLIVHP
ncbi:cupin domain-containing protein [Actinomadura adrarensis]|uniref:Cupin domain-containing protein n=1 Tax=Actinomadura adrarensis TaxID=1819600 RepID=A0ABW3CLA8_9ACTN